MFRTKLCSGEECRDVIEFLQGFDLRETQFYINYLMLKPISQQMCGAVHNLWCPVPNENVSLLVRKSGKKEKQTKKTPVLIRHWKGKNHHCKICLPCFPEQSSTLQCERLTPRGGRSFVPLQSPLQLLSHSRGEEGMS